MKIISISKTLLTATIIALTLTGCAPSMSPDVYNPYTTGQVSQTVKGVVDSARVVKVAGTSTVGTFAGGALGAIAGSAIGGGRASLLTAIGGGLVGAGVGNLAERRFTEKYAIEYVVRTRDGSLLSVVQGPSPAFQRGQHVLVIFGPQARVIANPDYAG